MRDGQRRTRRRLRLRFGVIWGFVVATLHLSSSPLAAAAVTNLSVMSFNIWVNGGTSLTQCIAAIRGANADLVGLQECNATTARTIATNLNFDFVGASDASIVSRYPIVQAIPSGGGSGAIIELSAGQRVYFFNCHLPAYPYGPYSMHAGRDQTFVVQQENQTRMPPLQALLGTMAPYLAGPAPCFLTGDFNAPSHLDYAAYPWPTSLACAQSGLLDSYRQAHPTNRLYPPAFAFNEPGITWTPRIDQEPSNAFDRIDFVYCSNDDGLTVIDSRELDARNSANPWPSDHRAVLSWFTLQPPAGSDRATQPTPASGAVNVSVNPLLSWVAGTNALSHRLLFGTADPPTFRTNQTNTTFAPGPLTPGSRYYWRVDEVGPSGIATGALWSFETASARTYEWHFTGPELRASLGNGTLAYADGAGTSNLVRFGVTDGTTLPHIAGQIAPYARVPALANPGNGFLVSFNDSGPNGGGVYLNQFTLILDLLIPAPLGFAALFNTNPQNANDADFYVDGSGRLGTGAIGFSAANTIQPGVWQRIVFAADLAAGSVRYYVDGTPVFTGSAALDGRYSLYSNVDPGPDLLLFNEGDTTGVYTHLLYVSSFALIDRTLTEAEIRSLGGAQDLGIFVATLPPLRIERVSDRARLTWPGYGTMRLQHSDGIAPAFWQDVPDTVGTNFAEDAPLGKSQFYRLIR